MKSPEDRSPHGRWLVAARLARGLKTAEDARKALHAAGFPIAKSTLAEYESGTKPISKNHMPELERFFGKFSDPAASQPVHPPSETAQLATALSDLALVIQGMRAEQAAWRRGIVTALAATEGPAREALLAALVPPLPESAQQ